MAKSVLLDKVSDTITAINIPNTLKVNITDAVICDSLFDILMGDKVEPRRDFIETHAVFATNIDI